MNTYQKIILGIATSIFLVMVYKDSAYHELNFSTHWLGGIKLDEVIRDILILLVPTSYLYWLVK